MYCSIWSKITTGFSSQKESAPGLPSKSNRTEIFLKFVSKISVHLKFTALGKIACESSRPSSPNATRAGSEEGRLFSQASGTNQSRVLFTSQPEFPLPFHSTYENSKVQTGIFGRMECAEIGRGFDRTFVITVINTAICDTKVSFDGFVLNCWNSPSSSYVVRLRKSSEKIQIGLHR